MARYAQPSKSQHLVTDPVYGSASKEQVQSGITTGEFVLMEQTAHAMENGRLVERKIRRYVPKAQVERRVKQNWLVVELGASEIADVATTPVKRGPGRPPKQDSE